MELNVLRTGALMSLPLALGLWIGMAGSALRRANCARILTFHGTPRARAHEYERQLRYLRRQFRIVPLAAMVETVAAGGELAQQLALTFDDGLRSNVRVVYPILRKLGLPATFFVCPGLIDEDKWLWNVEARERMRSLQPELARELYAEFSAPPGLEPFIHWIKTLDLRTRIRIERRIREASFRFVPTAAQREQWDLASWHDLRGLDPALITFGSHTVTHPILSHASAIEIETEVGDSRRLIEERLGRPADLFAYPNGDQNARVRAVVAKHYRAAVTTEQSWVQPGADPLLLPRVDTPRGAVRLCWNMHREEYFPGSQGTSAAVGAG
jgi:peptidoglycan/xylan/chitin deacetylase (PgdA/CDA1 family)